MEASLQVEQTVRGKVATNKLAIVSGPDLVVGWRGCFALMSETRAGRTYYMVLESAESDQLKRWQRVLRQTETRSR
jgi:hypothetical protein